MAAMDAMTGGVRGAGVMPPRRPPGLILNWISLGDM
jgi:hypothetical protein